MGLALGSGSARGWAHIGAIRALEQAGVQIDIVCGTSIGALVGAAYAAGEFDRFEHWARGLRIKDVVGFLDVSLSSGPLKGERLMGFLESHFTDRPLEELATPFAAVATSLRTGAEVWLRRGSTLGAVRASIALPGLLSPVLHEGAVLVDGGLVNPVPVSLARAMGAEVVIAIDLNSDMLQRRVRTERHPKGPVTEVGDWRSKLQDNFAALMPTRSPDELRMPAVLEVVASSIAIMQVRIARSRMAGEPPDLTVAPRLGHFSLLDFHRSEEAIEEGNRAVERVAHELPMLLG